MASNTSNLKRSYYVFENKPDAEIRGPFHPSQIRDLIEAGALITDCRISSENKPEWVALDEHPIKPIVAPERKTLTLQGAREKPVEAGKIITTEELVEESLSQEQRDARARMAKIKPSKGDGPGLPMFLFQLGFSLFLTFQYLLMSFLITEPEVFTPHWTDIFFPVAPFAKGYHQLLEATPDAGLTSLIIVISGIVLTGYSMGSWRYRKWVPLAVWFIIGVPLTILSTQVFAFLAMPIFVVQRTPVGAALVFIMSYRYLRSREYA